MDMVEVEVRPAKWKKEHHLSVADCSAAERHSSLELVAEQCSGRDEAEQEAVLVVAGQAQWNFAAAAAAAAAVDIVAEQQAQVVVNTPVLALVLEAPGPALEEPELVVAAAVAAGP